MMMEISDVDGIQGCINYIIIDLRRNSDSILSPPRKAIRRIALYVIGHTFQLYRDYTYLLAPPPPHIAT